MSHRDQLRSAGESLSAWLVVGAGALAVAQAVVAVGLGLLRAGLGELPGWLLVLVGGALGVGLSLPVHFLLALEAHDGAGPVGTLRTAASRWRAVLGASATVFGVGLVGGWLGAGLVLLGHTLVRYLEYAGGRVAPPSPWPILVLLVAGATLGFWVALALARPAVWLAAVDGRPVRSAWADALATARRSPGLVGGYLVAQTLTLGVSLVTLLFVAGASGAVPRLIALGLAVPVGVAGVGVAAAVHAVYVDPIGGVAPAVGGRSAVRRVAVAGVVVLAAVGGATAVRTADLEAGGTAPVSLGEDPASAHERAVTNTLTNSHRRVTTVTNESDPALTDRPVSETAIDYADRQLRIKLYGEGQYLGGIFGEGVIASHGPVAADGPVPEDAWLYSFPLPGYGMVARDVTESGMDDVDWALSNRSADRLVYRVEDPEQVARLYESGRRGTRGGLADGSHATLVVDRDAHVVETLSYRLVSRETGRAYTYRTSFQGVGETDVERPDSLHARGPLEWLWDGLYY